MCQCKLCSCNTIGKKITQSSGKKDTELSVKIQFFTKFINPLGYNRSGNGHGKSIGPNGGKAAVCQQNRLEQ